MNHSIIFKTVLVLAVGHVAGCATTTTPAELTTARASYLQAQQGAAASHDPAVVKLYRDELVKARAAHP